MSRRNQSTFEDLIGLAAMLPWWAGILLAFVAYFVIHSFAVEPVPTVAALNDMGQVAAKQMVRSFAIFGQYVLPALFLIGAVVSFIRREKKKRLLSTTASATSQNAVKSLSWQEFELLVGEAFRQQGFIVQETAAGADGGVDLEMRKGGELSLVQCKQWRATKVGVTVVREIFGVMAGRGADHGYVVTSGTYTKEAREFAEGRNITLIDGEVLNTMIKQVGSKSTDKPPANHKLQGRKQNMKESVDTQENIPHCPLCGGSMVKRVARRGTNSGKAFWGCEDFPKCRGTRKI